MNDLNVQEAARWLLYARHDLDALRNLLPDDWSVKHEQTDLAQLTEWAVAARYPGDWSEATLEDAQSALEQAGAIIVSILAVFSRRGIFDTEV